MDTFSKKSDNQDKKRIEDIFFAKIDEQRKKDSLIGAKLGSKEIFNLIIDVFKEPDGKLNCNSLLLFSGGLAGYACQAVVWHKYVFEMKMPVRSAFMVIEAVNNKTYYFGNMLNKYLLEDKYSVRSLIMGKFQNLYPQLPVPNGSDIIRKVASSVGNDEYRICGEVNPDEIIIQYNKAWESIKPRLTRYCKSPEEWHILFGMVVQSTMQISADIVSPEICFNTVMESAVYTSKIDISSVMIGGNDC